MSRKDVICALSASFHEKTQSGRRVAHSRRSTGKHKSWVIWGIWGISGAQASQDDMSIFADVFNNLQPDFLFYTAVSIFFSSIFSPEVTPITETTGSIILDIVFYSKEQCYMVRSI